MTRSINASVVTELQAENYRPFYLFKITIDSTDYLYTDCDVNILSGSDLYESKALKIDPIRYSDVTIVDKAKAFFKNVDEQFTALLVGSSVQGSPVEIAFVVLDSDYAIVNDKEILFDGELDEWELNESDCSMVFTNLFYQWSKKTINRHSASCRWRVFKNTQCGYSGSETWCDRSYARCQALSNTDNFGGFRFLPDIIGKEIFWGRKG